MDDEKTGAGVLVTQLGDKLGEKLVEAEEKAMAEHEVSGKMLAVRESDCTKVGLFWDRNGS